ncbi:hypothetical protein N7451_009409 [Penicillium sp. IBT 35674x]|nr:hypothetical protein N7451_009409 [Penicillium sp. IBT 35674x]
MYCTSQAKVGTFLHRKIRYGVVANIVVSHTTAGGSIPPIGVSFCISRVSMLAFTQCLIFLFFGGLFGW